MKQLYTFATICITLECLFAINDSVFAQGKNIVLISLEKNKIISNQTRLTNKILDTTYKKTKDFFFINDKSDNYGLTISDFKKYTFDEKPNHNRKKFFIKI